MAAWVGAPGLLSGLTVAAKASIACMTSDLQRGQVLLRFSQPLMHSPGVQGCVVADTGKG